MIYLRFQLFGSYSHSIEIFWLLRYLVPQDAYLPLNIYVLSVFYYVFEKTWVKNWSPETEKKLDICLWLHAQQNPDSALQPAFDRFQPFRRQIIVFILYETEPDHSAELFFLPGRDEFFHDRLKGNAVGRNALFPFCKFSIIKVLQRSISMIL